MLHHKVEHMFVTYCKLKNWRNFREADVHLAERSYVIGANAAGKSNFLDVFRFLRDICKSTGGGLQKAVAERDGISKLRCLHARQDTEVRIEVHLAESLDADCADWKYILGFKAEAKGTHRLFVSCEEVWHGEVRILCRPGKDDEKDIHLLTETHLEQIRANAEFRTISDTFSGVTYLHLVPQLLKYGDKIGGNRLEDDPFGQGILERIARSPGKTRDARLKKINSVLSAAVPQFRSLRFKKDDVTGRPHLEALYEHYRPNAGWQREDQFSDGTLRLIGLLWALLDGDSLLLIEEPELSLHKDVVEQVPLLIERIQRRARYRRQVIISTHSEAILKNPGIDAKSIVILEPGQEGTKVRPVSREESEGLAAGFSVAEVVLPQTRPKGVEQLALW